MLQSTDDANTKTFTVLHVVSCNPKWLQTINLSSSYTQQTSGYCTPCASLRTSARQTDALPHGRRLAKLRHVMWRALNQWTGRILVRGVIRSSIVQEKEVYSFHTKTLNLREASGMKPFSGTWKHTILWNEFDVLFHYTFGKKRWES